MRLVPRCLIVFLLVSTLRAGEPLYYTFANESGGGIAALRAEPASGEILDHRVVFAHADANKALKVSLSQNRRHLAANLAGVENARNLVLVDLGDDSHRFLDFKEEVDHILFVMDRLYVGTTAGSLYRIHPERGLIEREWNFRKALTPPGRRPEDFVCDESANQLWVSFQKDNRKRSQFGSRLVGIDLATDQIFADLQLPRDRPELHYAPDVDGRESGPNPEVLRVIPAANLLFVTLDLYGAVGVADLDAARRGRLENWRVFSTSPDGSWSSAFPDRVGDARIGGRDLLLVANASAPGGIAVFDPQARRVAQILPAPGGLTTLEYLPSVDRVVTASAGKIKARGTGGLENNSTPLPLWVRLAPGEGPEGPQVQSLAMDGPVHWAMPVDRATSPLVYLNVGENAGEWLVLDARTAEVRARVKAHGRVGRSTRTP